MRPNTSEDVGSGPARAWRQRGEARRAIAGGRNARTAPARTQASLLRPLTLDRIAQLAEQLHREADYDHQLQLDRAAYEHDHHERIER